MLICIDTQRTCDFRGGVRTPIPPSGSAHVLTTCSQQADFAIIIFRQTFSSKFIHIELIQIPFSAYHHFMNLNGVLGAEQIPFYSIKGD